MTGEAIPSTNSLLPTICKARKNRGVSWRRESLGVARVNKVTPVSFGNPLSVFNKNSTLKERETWGRGKTTKGGSTRGKTTKGGSTRPFGYLRTHTEFFPHTHMEFQVGVVSECIFRFAYTGMCTCGCLTTPRFADDSRDAGRDRAPIARHSTPIARHSTPTLHTNLRATFAQKSENPRLRLRSHNELWSRLRHGPVLEKDHVTNVTIVRNETTASGWGSC